MSSTLSAHLRHILQHSHLSWFDLEGRSPHRASQLISHGRQEDSVSSGCISFSYLYPSFRDISMLRQRRSSFGR
jgi:hypothetical protein